jgi:hypothetical protein
MPISIMNLPTLEILENEYSMASPSCQSFDSRYFLLLSGNQHKGVPHRYSGISSWYQGFIAAQYATYDDFRWQIDFP